MEANVASLVKARLDAAMGEQLEAVLARVLASGGGRARPLLSSGKSSANLGKAFRD